MPQATPRIRYVGLDGHKETITVAVAEEAGRPEAWGTIANDPQAVRRLVRQLGREGWRLKLAYEAGPTGYVLQNTCTRRGVGCALAGSPRSGFGQCLLRRAVKRWGLEPDQVVSDHHPPYVRAVKGVLPGATHIRTGLHRRRGETTKSIERSHVAIRDRLSCSRDLKSVIAGQRFLEGFEAVQALSRGDVLLRQLVPGYRPTLATHQQRVRAVVAAMHLLGARLTKAA